MNQPISAPAERSPLGRFLRRTAATLILGVIFFVVLWVTVFNAATSALVASGGAVVLVAGSSVSETFQSIFEVVTDFILGLIAAVVDFFAGLFN